MHTYYSNSSNIRIVFATNIRIPKFHYSPNPSTQYSYVRKKYSVHLYSIYTSKDNVLVSRRYRTLVRLYEYIILYSVQTSVLYNNKIRLVYVAPATGTFQRFTEEISQYNNIAMVYGSFSKITYF